MKPKKKVKGKTIPIIKEEISLRRSIKIRKGASEETGLLRRSERLLQKYGDITKTKTKFPTRKSIKKQHRRVASVGSTVTNLRKRQDNESRKSARQGVKEKQQGKGKFCLNTKQRNTKFIVKALKEENVGAAKHNRIQRKRKQYTAEKRKRTQLKEKQAVKLKRKRTQTIGEHNFKTNRKGTQKNTGPVRAIIELPMHSLKENSSKWKHTITFDTDKHYYGDEDKTRYCDVVFLDENHILAVDDSYLKAGSGYRVCCFQLDGTFVADLPLPGYPWTVLAISPTEAVVTLRRTGSRGLIWVSIDVERGVIECTKNVAMEHDAYGITYDKDKRIFVVSHFQESMTILNQAGDFIGKIPVPPGATYRCVFSGENIIYLDNHKNYMKAIDFSGNETISFPKQKTTHPVDIDNGVKGNVYLVNFEQNVCQFDAKGNYVTTLFSVPDICGIGLNAKSDHMAVAHKKSISIYKLEK